MGVPLETAPFFLSQTFMGIIFCRNNQDGSVSLCPTPPLAGDQPRGGAITLSLPSVGINGEGAVPGPCELTVDSEPEGVGCLGKEITPPKIDS